MEVGEGAGKVEGDVGSSPRRQFGQRRTGGRGSTLGRSFGQAAELLVVEATADSAGEQLV